MKPRFVIVLLIAVNIFTKIVQGNETEELFNAIRFGNVDVVTRLIENSSLVNAENRDGILPLLFAASKNKMEIIKVLVDHGADVNSRDNSHSTPLHKAVQY
ncbi:cyclin-dependent kinase 4 inhibitor D-like, partial [Contarinia nasturtii]|uniref:cyclin-dependent kinase 4 inhibitor D-like n=1 Tax=Contarinia nasturtii TaxID=265458 RepID=UPI0012D4391A